MFLEQKIKQKKKEMLHELKLKTNLKKKHNKILKCFGHIKQFSILCRKCRFAGYVLDFGDSSSMCKMMQPSVHVEVVFWWPSFEVDGLIIYKVLS